jgi:hypothetical protein
MLRGLGNLLEMITVAFGDLLIQRRAFAYLGQFMTRLVVELSKNRKTDCAPTVF